MRSEHTTAVVQQFLSGLAEYVFRPNWAWPILRWSITSAT